MTERKRRPAGPVEQVDQLLRDAAAWQLVERSIVVRGEEDYLALRAQEVVSNRAKELDYEVLVRDGSDGRDSVSEISGELATPPMFAPRQLFVLRGFEAQLKSAGKKPAPLVAALLSFVEREDPERAVLLVAPGLRADHVFVKKAVRTIAVRRLYDSPPPWSPDPLRTELAVWIGRRAREFGVRLEPRELLYVAAATGNDLAAIDAQLERIKAMGSGSVRAAATWQASVSPFDAADHLVAGDLARALADVTGLFAGGAQQKSGARVVDPAGLTAMLLTSLGRTVRQGLSIAEARAAGASPDAALEAGGATGNAVEPWRRRMTARPRPHEWARMLADVGELERAARTASGVGAEHFTALALRWRKSAGAAARGVRK